MAEIEVNFLDSETDYPASHCEHRHVHHDCIVAFAEGKQIQVKGNKGWTDTPQPKWLSTLLYRVKPQPEYYRVALVRVDDRNYPAIAYTEKEAKVFMARKNFIEWISTWIPYDHGL